MNGIHQQSIGIYAGTFDPLTNGHCDVIRRASRLFGTLLVAIGTNTSKAQFFSVEERVSMMKAVCKDLGPNIEVKAFRGLVVKFAAQEGAQVMIRGLRSPADFAYELQMAMMNKTLDPKFETIFIPTSQELAHISSSLVKEVSLMGGDVSQMVPPLIFSKLQEKGREKI